jgi:hypothetical protein
MGRTADHAFSRQPLTAEAYVQIQTTPIGIYGILSGSSLHATLPVSFYQDTKHIHSSTTAAVPP